MHRFHIVSLCPDEPSLFFLFVLFNRRRGPGFALKGSRCLHGEEKSRRLPERNSGMPSSSSLLACALKLSINWAQTHGQQVRSEVNARTERKSEGHLFIYARARRKKSDEEMGR